jgi:hypothetical protein
MVPILGLDRNREITTDELARCARLVAALRTVPASESFGTEAQWTTPWGVPAHDLTRYPLDAFDADFVRMLRLHSYIFTGYHLSDVLTGTRTPTWAVPAWVPADWADWEIPVFQLYREQMPAELLITPPLVAGEVGFDVFGYCVNRDVVAYLDRIKLMAEAGIIARLRQLERPRILEIGGGYGGLAWFLTRVVPRASYTIVDLRTSLMHSGCYLSVAQSTHPVRVSDGIRADARAEIELVPNTIAEALGDRHFDLAINTISFAEMPAEVVRRYAGLIDRTLNPDGALFEQNATHDPHASGRDNFSNPETILAERLRLRARLTHASAGLFTARLWVPGVRT